MERLAAELGVGKGGKSSVMIYETSEKFSQGGIRSVTGVCNGLQIRLAIQSSR